MRRATSSIRTNPTNSPISTPPSCTRRHLLVGHGLRAEHRVLTPRTAAATAPRTHRSSTTTAWSISSGLALIAGPATSTSTRLRSCPNASSADRATGATVGLERRAGVEVLRLVEGDVEVRLQARGGEVQDRQLLEQIDARLPGPCPRRRRARRRNVFSRWIISGWRIRKAFITYQVSRSGSRIGEDWFPT